MRSSGYRSAILLGAAALLSLASALYASVDAKLPAAPELDASIVHGVEAYDRAALRAAEPDYAVADATGGVLGPIVSLKALEGYSEVERDGPWYIARPTDAPILAPDLDDASVRLEGATERRCKHSGEKHICGSAGWQVVEPTTRTIAGRSQDCIWAHPIANSRLIIEYPAVAGGPWRVQFGLVDAAVGTGTPVKTRVQWAGETFEHTHPDRRGFTSLNLPAHEEIGPLTLEIWAENVGRRHFCYRIAGP